MNETLRALAGQFVWVDLGAADGSTMAALRGLRKAITLIELDAVAEENSDPGDLFNRVAIKGAVVGSSGKRPYYVRSFSQSSSFLKTNDNIVRDYGLESFVHIEKTLDLMCDTRSNLLASLNVKDISFLKTDLEGLDTEVLISSSELVTRTLVIQSELRLQPYYIGEPPFHEATAFLYKNGHELVEIRPERWKYKTINRDVARDGRLAWADFIFMLGESAVRERFGPISGLAFAKQAIVMHALGLTNIAEHLADLASPELPPGIARELRTYLGQGTHHFPAHASTSLLKIRGVGILARPIRRLCRIALDALSFSRPFPHIAP